MKTKNDCKQYIYSRKEDEKKGINLFLWWRSLIPLCRSDQVFLDSYQKQTFLLKERKKKKERPFLKKIDHRWRVCSRRRLSKVRWTSAKPQKRGRAACFTAILQLRLRRLRLGRAGRKSRLGIRCDNVGRWEGCDGGERRHGGNKWILLKPRLLATVEDGL